jgi:hypothetical protein
MTLNNVVLDAGRVFAAGQLGVGMSRVRGCTGLRILNYKRAKCPKHDDAVFSFYEKPAIPVYDDISCCRYTGIFLFLSMYND